MTNATMFSEAELIEQAVQLQHDNQPHAACELLQAALSLNPDNSTSAFLLGTQLVSLNQFRQALVWLEKALASNPVWVDALTFKAHALASLHLWEETKRWAEQRRLFGKPLSKMQNTQFKMVELWADLSAAHALVRACVEQLLEGGDATALDTNAK